MAHWDTSAGRMLLILLGMALSASSSAQDSSATGHRWYVQASIAPEVGYRALTVEDEGTSGSGFIGKYHGSDGGQLGYRAEFSIARRCGEKWLVSTGIGYTDIGFRSNTYPQELIFGNWLDPYAGIIYTTNMVPPPLISSKKHFRYIEVPLEFRILCGHGRIRPTVRFGGSAAMLQKATHRAEYVDSNGDNTSYEMDITDTYRSLTLFAFLGGGITWSTNSRMALFVLPTFRYGALDMFEGNLSQKLWGGQLAVGLTWGL